MLVAQNRRKLWFMWSYTRESANLHSVSDLSSRMLEMLELGHSLLLDKYERSNILAILEDVQSMSCPLTKTCNLPQCFEFRILFCAAIITKITWGA